MDNEGIYPQLPQIQENPQNFRLQQISEIKKFFEEEIEFRRRIYSKYKKAFDVITGFTHFINLASITAGSIGVSALAGLITAPIGLALGGVTIGGAVISTALTWEKKNVLHKLEKHEKIEMLAVSKLNTINDLVSKAITDSHISTEEFSLLTKEKEKYVTMKNNIRKNKRETNQNIDVESLKKTFVEEGKKIAQNEMIEKLKKQ